MSGWNALVFEEGSDFPIPVDTTAIPMSAIAHNDSVTIGGSAAEGFQERLILLPAVTLEGGEVEEVLYDEELGETWEISVSGAPPDDHLTVEDDGVYGFELPVAYTDNDGSGGLTDGDEGLGFACYDEETVALIWSPSIEDPVGAWYAAAYGLATGWSALGIPEDEASGPTLIPEEDLGSLAIDGTCAL